MGGNNSISFSPAAAAAKSLQSCPTLCDPTDGNPSGSAIPGILQARTLEWVAISFSTFSPDSPLKQILSSFTSVVTQMIKYLPAMQETQVQSLGQENPWRREWQHTPVFLPRESMDRGAWWATTPGHGVAESQD